MNTLMFLMGGSGTRFGAEIPKQYVPVNGIPIFYYVLKAYADIEEIDNIVIVSHKDWLDFVKEWSDRCGTDKIRGIVAGGDTRSESIKNGLACAEKFSEKDDVILFHDATHPYVDKPGTLKVIDAVKECGGATLASFNYDVVYRQTAEGIVCEDIPRRQIVEGASPEAFTFGRIYDVYMHSPKEELEAMTSAGAIALAYGFDIKVIELGVLNLKITYPRDMVLFKKLVDNYFFENFEVKNNE